MKHDDDPPRLRDEEEASSPLGQALERSRKDLPTGREMADLASSLSAVLPDGAMGRVQPSPDRNRSSRPMRPLLLGSAVSFKLLLAALVGALGAGTLIWRMQIPERAPAASVPSVSESRTKASPLQGLHTIEPLGLAPPDPPAEARSNTRTPSLAEKASPPEKALKTEHSVENGLPTGAAAFPDSGRSTEIALLNRAHRSLGSDPKAALSLAEEHAHEFPNGTLAQEREFIAIQALLALGRKAEAASRADRFRAAFPGSAHIRRLDLLFGNTERHAPE